MFPEIAACFGIHAGGGLVEQQQLRRVQQTCGKRKPLLPSARQRAGKLCSPGSETEAIERRFHCVVAFGHRVHPRDEVEVFFDRQIFVEAEALRHVADFPLDLRRVGANIVAKAGSLAGVGRQKPAQHADRRRLAAAVRTQKAEDLAALDANREIVDDGVPIEALGQAAHVDGGVGRRVHRSMGCLQSA